MPLKTKRATYIEVEYHDLQQLIREVYKQPDYNVVAEEEWSNDTSHTFTIERAALTEFETRDIEEFIARVAPERRLELLTATSVTNEFLNRPDMIGQIRRHRGCPS